METENKTSDLLTKKKFTNFCPVNRIKKAGSGKKKLLTPPLFTSCLFVYSSLEEHATINQINGVINFLYWLGKPAVISNEEIGSLREFLEESENITVEKVSVDPNKTLEYTEEPVLFQEGQIFEIKNRSVKLALP